MSIGYQISKFREERGISQRVLAGLSGIPQPNLSKIEQGKQDITVSTLQRIGAALGVSVRNFFDEEISTEGHFKEKQFNRTFVERMADAVIAGKAPKAPLEKQLFEKLRLISVLKPSQRKSRRKVYQAWYELKRQLSPSQIRILCERIQDAGARQS